MNKHAGHYTYDIHGNVDTLLQDNQQLSLISTALQPQRFKKIIYDFDLISGNVNLVSYQDGQPDAFYHFYEYDADNRIIAVYSSNYPQKNALINLNTVANSPLWDNDAKYFYYAHGPLARVEYGDNKVQGEDYAYTLQGWIKGVNSNTLDTLRDIGKDGAIGSINSIFAKDAFGYTLNYHANDYNAISYLRWNNVTDRFEAATIGSDLVGGTSLPPSGGAGGGLFNGNITSMVTTIVPPTLPKSDSVAFSPLPQGTAYRYDQLNRLVEMKAWQNLNTVTNTWGSGLAYNGMYHNQFTYDANGSILTAMANNQAGQTIDNQIYHHQTVNGRKFRNRTYAITDSASITSGDDLLNQTAYTNNADSVNVYNNYSYTEIGERKSDVQDSITLITWTVYGKLDSVARIPGSSKYNLKFNYDAQNKRIAKKVYTSDNTWLYSEYYVRDEEGNILSTYKHQTIDSTSTVSFAQTEKEIYGSSELGIDITKTELISALPVSNIFTRTLDNKHFTGSNHLGNVLTTFTDRKLPIDADNNGIIDAFWPDVIASNDYMPFGALLTERTFKKGTFPNSFNGKRDDAELDDCQDYGEREYAKKAREFTSDDPLITQEQEYPELSPYQFASNSPIENKDLDGLESSNYGNDHEGFWQNSTDDQKLVTPVPAFLNDLGVNILNLFGVGTIDDINSTINDPSKSTAQKVGEAAETIISTATPEHVPIEGGEHGVTPPPNVETHPIPDAQSPKPAPKQEAPKSERVNNKQTKKSPPSGKGSKGYNIKEKNTAPGKKYTAAQKRQILEQNKAKNNGVLKSDKSGKKLDPPQKMKKGQKANMNQAEVDHNKARSKGGKNSGKNARVLSKAENLKKGNR